MVSSTISFQLGDCMEGRHLCTPAKATVEPVLGSPGEYRVVLPGHMQWCARIPNKAGAPLEILSPAGIVCRDERDAESCAPPIGSRAGAAGEGFLVPDARAGALVMRLANGATEFSVNDRPAKAFENNQGFFEFHVRVAIAPNQRR
jgi:hypothetical protein